MKTLGFDTDVLLSSNRRSCSYFNINVAQPSKNYSSYFVLADSDHCAQFLSCESSIMNFDVKNFFYQLKNRCWLGITRLI